VQGHLSRRQIICIRTLAPQAAWLGAQVRAMQIIDELEAAQRGPYGGGIGHVAFTGGMDMALALRTMIIPNPPADGAPGSGNGVDGRSSWTVHIQVDTSLLPMMNSKIKETMSSCRECSTDSTKAALSWRSMYHVLQLHMQAGAGLVADSVPDSEYEETVNKAAALGRAIDLAEQAFVDC
jgi:anthranilate synthase component I